MLKLIKGNINKIGVFNNIYIIAWLLLLIIVGTWVRFHTLDQYYYGNDEVMHMQISEGKDIGEVWQFSRYETHPPLGHFIRHYWLKFSTDPTWVRSMSIFSDILLIILYFAIGKRFSTGVGIAASFLATFSNAFISLSRVVRNYSIFALFSAACFYFYLRYCESKENKWLVFYTIFGCAAVSTHFGGIIPIIGFSAITFFAQLKKKENPLKWVLSNSIIVIFFLIGALSQHWSNYYIYPFAVYDALATQYSVLNIIYNGINALLYSLSYPFFMLPSLPDIVPYLGFKTSVPFVIFISSLCLLYKNHKNLFYVIIMSLIAFYILVSLGLYNPENRRNIWLAPFVIVPASMLISNIYNRIYFITKPNKDTFVKAFIVFLAVVAGVFSVASDDIYNHQGNEASKKDISAMQDFINNNVKEKDVIVGGRASMIPIYYYLTGGNYYYSISELHQREYYIKNHVDIQNMPIKDTFSKKIYISAPFDLVFYTYQMFLSFFENVAKNNWLDNVENIWLVSVGSLNTTEKRILNCSSVKPEISNVFMAHSIWISSINKSTLYELMKPDGKYKDCFNKPKS